MQLKNCFRCDRALWHMKVNDENGNEKPLIDLVKFDEVYDGTLYKDSELSLSS